MKKIAFIISFIIFFATGCSKKNSIEPALNSNYTINPIVQSAPDPTVEDPEPNKNYTLKKATDFLIADKDRKTVLFFIPHPDDEVLSMGMGIANQVWQGYNVYVIMLSHGEAVGVLEDINGDVFCRWHNMYHSPQKSGYPRLTTKDLADARVREYQYAVACLGVKPENTLIYDLPDGKMNKEDIKEIMRYQLKEHPGAAVRSTSYLDGHLDHRANGNALLDLYNSGEVKDARFYLSPALWNGKFGTIEANAQLTDMHKASLAVYKRWNPSSQIYGIGYHSIISLFDTVSSKLTSTYHGPNEKMN
jgi:LmbE family N-acetylglucosaminyl deacetylase